jgi:chromosome segregation ATPase
MEDNDDYEILPHKEISDLKKQIEAYRKGPPSSAQNSMDKLTDSMNTLITIFREASTSMSIEDKEKDILTTQIAPLSENVDKLLDQNKKIAEGIVALADMIKDLQDSMDELAKKQASQQQPQQMFQRQPQMQQQMGMGQPMGIGTMGAGEMPFPGGMEEMPPLPPFTPQQRMQPMGIR